MTTAPDSLYARHWTAAVASLAPWAAFLLAVGVGDGPTSLGRIAAAAPFYLGFIALPSLAPVVAARPGMPRVVVAAVMTAVAAISGVLVATSDDAQAGLAALWVPLVALPLAAVLWMGWVVIDRRAAFAEPDAPASPGPSDRIAALAIDVAIVGAALVLPLTAMSQSKQEVAAALVGVAVATIYLAAPVVWRGRTIGQSLLRLAVVDTRTQRPLQLSRALLRSVIIVVEVAAIPTIILAIPAIAELMSVVGTGRSLTDRILRTSVVTDSMAR